MINEAVHKIENPITASIWIVWYDFKKCTSLQNLHLFFERQSNCDKEEIPVYVVVKCLFAFMIVLENFLHRS